MIVCKIIGGLGNQMFQYAAAKSLAFKNNSELRIDPSGFRDYSLRTYQLDIFNLPEKKIGPFYVRYYSLRKLKSLRFLLQPVGGVFVPDYYYEPHFEFDENLMKFKNNVYLDGYWQSEKYFKSISNQIARAFTFPEVKSLNLRSVATRIQSVESVSIHVRRGDYVNSSVTNKLHGTCTLEYYKNAISYISSIYKDLEFFVFSDDIQWAQENLKFVSNAYFIKKEVDSDDWEEMSLMSMCRHNIIANSSFSWWGAWLNKNSNKVVVAPEKWFNDPSINSKDVIPENWVVL